MQLVVEHLANQVRQRNKRLLYLFCAWFLLVIVDSIFGIAKAEWVGFPVFVVFAVLFSYYSFFGWPRCPKCQSVIHVQTSYSFRSLPDWMPQPLSRLVPTVKYCKHCGLSFYTPMKEVDSNVT